VCGMVMVMTKEKRKEAENRIIAWLRSDDGRRVIREIELSANRESDAMKRSLLVTDEQMRIRITI